MTFSRPGDDWLITADADQAELPAWRLEEIRETRELAKQLPTGQLREMLDRHRRWAAAGDESAMSDDSLGVLAAELASRQE